MFWKDNDLSTETWLVATGMLYAAKAVTYFLVSEPSTQMTIQMSGGYNRILDLSFRLGFASALILCLAAAMRWGKGRLCMLLGIVLTALLLLQMWICSSQELSLLSNWNYPVRVVSVIGIAVSIIGLVIVLKSLYMWLRHKPELE